MKIKSSYRMLFAMIVATNLTSAFAESGALQGISSIRVGPTLLPAKLDGERSAVVQLTEDKLRFAEISLNEDSTNQLKVTAAASGSQVNLKLELFEQISLPNNPTVKQDVSVWSQEVSCSQSSLQQTLAGMLDSFCIQYLRDNRSQSAEKNKSSTALSSPSTAAPMPFSPLPRLEDALRKPAPGPSPIPPSPTPSSNQTYVPVPKFIVPTYRLPTYRVPPPGPSPTIVSAKDPTMEGSTELKDLNNAGVSALNASNFTLAISNFERALRIEPSYKLARNNLATALNNYGLSLQNTDTAHALDCFDTALNLVPANAVTLANVNGMIRKMGKDPNDLITRLGLAQVAVTHSNNLAAISEYEAALSIKDLPEIHQKIEDLQNKEGHTTEFLHLLQSADIEAQNSLKENKVDLSLTKRNDSTSVVSPRLAPNPTPRKTELIKPSPVPRFTKTVQTQTADFAPYLTAIEPQIKGNWHPPSGNQTRCVKVIFRLSRDGTISEARVSETSELNATDDAALSAVKNSSPLKGPYPQKGPSSVEVLFNFDQKVVYGSAEQSNNSPKTASIDWEPYLSDLQRRIKRAWFPVKGTEFQETHVVFRIDRSGGMHDLRILASGGQMLVDVAALKAVENAAPFRPLPSGASESIDMLFIFYNDSHIGVGGGDSVWGGLFR